MRFEEARANALRLRRQRSTVRHVANALLRPALARGFRAFRGHMMRMRRLAKVCQRAHMHARCTVQKAFFTMKAQRTRGDALSIVQASGRWVREAGVKAMRVWLRRRARTFVLYAWRVWLRAINEQRLENQRRLTSNLNLVQGASAPGTDAETVALLYVSDFPQNLARPCGSTKAPPRSQHSNSDGANLPLVT